MKFAKSILLSILLLVGLGLINGISAEIVTEEVEYQHDDATLLGYLAYDNSIKGERPGVLIVHQWKGITDYERRRARELAQMGYIAFAADIYGKNIRPQTTEEASQQAGKYRGDRQLLRARTQAGLDVLRDHKYSQNENIAAIGYCFGGGTVLELARSGADIAGVVSFHGNLDTPDPSHANNIVCKVLAQHGSEDPYVPTEDVIAFQKEMNDADVDWYMIEYGNAVHSFTHKEAGNDPSQGAAYNEKADKRSWRAMQDFFNEIFK